MNVCTYKFSNLSESIPQKSQLPKLNQDETDNLNSLIIIQFSSVAQSCLIL